jgi:hypothetical protein
MGYGQIKLSIITSWFQVSRSPVVGIDWIPCGWGYYIDKRIDKIAVTDFGLWGMN